MKLILLAIIGIHGVIHLIGFVKAFNPSAVSQLTQPISKFSGMIWLFTASLFIISAALYFINYNLWWISAVCAIIVSQILILQNWNDAKFGTCANLIILIPVIISIMNFLPSSYFNIYRSEVSKRLHPISNNLVVTEKTISHLPEPVKKYLRYTGSIGRDELINMRVNFEGSMRRDISAKWIDINSNQYNFFSNHARLFYIKSSIFGLPFDGLHAYIDGHAIMQIKILSIFNVVDARGKEMNQSENVTMLNDICLFSPAALIDKKIKWEPVDSLTAKAFYTHNGITISASLYFNNKGELINFISDDRYLSADGKTYKNCRWSTPVKEYISLDGRRLAGYAEAIWSLPEGEFSYAKFRLKEAEYNCTEFKKQI